MPPMTTNKTVIFRVDGNQQLGLGHIMRCLTLAKRLHSGGFSILFICSQSNEGALSLVKKNHYDIALIPFSETAENDAKPCLDIIRGLDVVLVVTDHYMLDFCWEKILYSELYSLLVIDDLANRKHYCDVLVDSSYGRVSVDYDGLCNESCKLLLGSDYCLLRPEFRESVEVAVRKRQSCNCIQTVLINFGATDHKGFSKKCVEILKLLNFEGSIRILLSSASDSRSELEAVCANTENVYLHLDEPNVPALMLTADLAIGSVGTSSWERCCLGLPTIGIVVAANQLNIAAQLENIGAMRLCEYENLIETLGDMVPDMNVPRWKEMSEKSFKVCDGLGLERVVHNLIPDSLKVTLHEMSEYDESILYLWQCEPGNRRFSGTALAPTREEHHAWFSASLENTSRRMWLVMFDGIECGYVRLDCQGDGEEVSVLISNKYRKLGLAYGAINELKTLGRFGVLNAKVSSENLASISLFKKLEFIQVANSDFKWVMP